MIRLRPLFPWLPTAKSFRRTWGLVCAAGLSAVANFADPGSAGCAFGQTGYAPVQMTDPRSVFMGAPDSAPTPGWGTPASRPSPYFDYRSDTPAAARISPVPVADYGNGVGMGGTPVWAQGGSFPGGQPSYTPTPYSANGRYANPPGGMNDPRAGSPHAGTPYFSPGPGSSVINGGMPAPLSMNSAYPAGGPTPGYGGHGGCAPQQQAGCENPDYANNRDNCILYTPFVSMAYLGGTTPSTGYNDLFVPLIQNQYHMLFGDVRGLYNNQAYQGSFGGGVRSRFWDSVIFGRYGYYDYRHTDAGNQFQQATVGMELLAWRWEARTNGYIPVANNSGSGGGGAAGTAFLQNGLIFLQGTQQMALSGIDGEFGALLAADSTAHKELRAFVGGYYFNGPTGAQDIPGISGRLEARIYDLPFLGEGSRLEMGVISTYDDTYKYQVTGLMNVRIALGRPTCNCSCGLSLIERRMLDRVIRRQDILTSNQSTSTETATANIYGNPASSIVVVHQGDDLKSVVESAPAKSVIVVDGAGGGPYLLPNGVTLAPGETLVGGGSHIQVVGNSSGHIGDLLLPGSRPTLERDNTTGAVVTMSSGTSVIGLDLIGGSSGIFGTNINTLCINDVNISHTGTDGAQLINVDGLDIYKLSITDTGGQGLLLQNANNTEIYGLTISHTVGSSLYYNCGTNIRIDGLTVDATGANNDAVRFHTQNKAVFTDFDIRNSAFTALRIESSTVVSFDRIKLTQIEGDGIVAYQSGTFDFSHLAMTYVDGSAVVINDTALVSVNNSTFTDAHNVISYLNTVHYISGTGNVSLGQTTLSTGTTNGGGSVQFTTPNGTAP